jgi:hypothetical protein
MKFANNQPELFVSNGAGLSFLIGIVQYLTALHCEIINIYMLTYQKDVEYSIIHFVALKLVAMLPGMYFASQDYG